MLLFPYLQIAALIFFYVQYNFIVSEEEGYLKKAFSNDYSEYLKRVPKFIPRLTSYKPSNKIPQPPFNLKAGLKSERRSLQAFSIITLIIILLWLLRRF